MDPDIQREYEEHLRTMNDLLSQQAAATSKLLSSMQSGASSAKNNADATRKQTEATDKQTEAVAKTTKLQEATAVALEKQQQAMQNFSNAMSNGQTAVFNFTKAVMNGERSLEKYGSTFSSAGDAAFDVGKNFGILGTVIGGLVKAFGAIAGASFQAVDSVVKFRDETTKFAGVMPVSLDGIQKLGSEARFSGDEIMKLSKTMSGFGTNILALGGSAGEGAVKFMKMSAVSDDVRRSFGRLGVDQDRLNELQGMYIQMQGISGKSMENRTKTEGQLQKESLAYAKNLILMSDLTGQTAEQMQKEREVVKAEFEEQVKIRQENIQIERLKAEAASATTEADKQAKLNAAAAIKQEQDNRTALITTMTDTYGKEIGSQYGRMARTGAYDSFTGGLASLGVSATEVKNMVQKSTDAQGDSLKQAEKFTKLQNNQVEAAGDSLQYMGEEQAKNLGITNETITKGNNYLGKNLTEEYKKAQATAAAKEAEGKKTEDELEKVRSAERELRKVVFDALYDFGTENLAYLASMMSNLAKGVIWLDQAIRNNWETIKLFGAGIASAIAILAGFKVIKGIAPLFGGLKTALSGMIGWLKGMFGGKPGAAAAKSGTPAAPTLGADGRYRDEKGRFAKAPAAGTAGSTAVSNAGKVAKVLGKLTGPLAALGAITVGASEFADASRQEKSGEISGEEASSRKKEAVGGAAGGVFGGLGGAAAGAAIGTMIAPGIGTAVGGILGGLFGGTLGEGIGRSISKHFETILDMVISPVTAIFSPFVAVGTVLKDNWESLVSIGESLFSITTDVVKLAFFPIYFAGKKVAEGLDWLGKKFKPVIDPVVSAFTGLRKAIKSIVDWIAGILSSVSKGFGGFVDSLYGDDKKKAKPAAKPKPATKPKPAAAKPATAPAAAKPAAAPAAAKAARTGTYDATTAGDAAQYIGAPGSPEDAKKEERRKDATTNAEKQATAAASNERSSSRTEIVTADFAKSTIRFNLDITTFARLVTAYAKTVHAFAVSVGTFATVIKQLAEKIEMMGTGVGTTSGTTGSSGAPSGAKIPQNVQGNLEAIAKGMRKKGFGDENYINAVLGNVMKESGGRFDKVENLDYSKTSNDRIRDIFKTKTKGMSEVELDKLKADPQAFTNKMYGGAMGNKEPGDGWKYRGRGPIQLTGKANYAKASQDIYGDDRLVKDPDLVLQPDVGVEVVAWFMKKSEKSMKKSLGFSPDQALSKQEAALLATSQIAGQKITRGSGYLGTENLSKVESYASSMPTGVGAGGKFSSGGAADPASAKLISSKPENVKVGENADLSGVNSTLLSKFFTAAKEFGSPITVNSAYRGDDYQAQLWVRGNILKEAGIHTPARPKNTTKINYKGREYTVDGSGKGSRHGRGEALDISGDRQGFDPVLNKYGLHRPFAAKDPPHVELKAAKGGVFSGPKSGYPVELHGGEMVAPLTMDSILMKLAKTPAESVEPTMLGANQPNESIEKMVQMHSELMDVLSRKLDSVIDVLDDGNTTRTKLLKNSQS